MHTNMHFSDPTPMGGDRGNQQQLGILRHIHPSCPPKPAVLGLMLD